MQNMKPDIQYALVKTTLDDGIDDVAKVVISDIKEDYDKAKSFFATYGKWFVYCGIAFFGYTIYRQMKAKKK